MKKVLIHIGTEKTGTTSIQEYLHTNRSQLAKQGVAYLKTPGLTNNRKLVTYCMSDDYIDDQVKDLGIVTDELRKKWKQQFKEEITQEINCLEDHIHSVIISSEHFHSRFRYDFEVNNLLEFLRPFFSEIKVIVYLRRQDEMAVSLYSTLCRNGWSRESVFPEYVSAKDHYYNYFEMLERWSAILGKENIILKIFELSKLEGRDIISDFVKSSGIILEDSALKRPKSQNESLSSTAQEVLVSFNKCLPKYDNNEPNHLFNYLRSKLIQNLQASHSDSPKLPNRAEAIKFYGIFHESNQQLSRKYFKENISFSDDFSRYPVSTEAPNIDKSTLDVIFQTFETCLQALPPLSLLEIDRLKKRVENAEKQNSQQQLISLSMEIYDKARVLHQQGQIDDAVRDYLRAIDLNPVVPSFHQKLGDAMKDLQRWDEAIERYRNVIDISSDNTWAYYSLGYTFALQGNWKEALASYSTFIDDSEKTIKDLPNPLEFDTHSSSYLFHFKLGKVLFANNSSEEAIISIRNCLEINPDFIPGYELLLHIFEENRCLDDAHHIYLRLGEALCREKKLDAAIVAFNKSIELNSNSCWSFNCLGNVYYWKSDLENAIICYQKAVQLKPDFTAAYQQLGNIFSSKGDIDNATVFYNLALKHESLDSYPEVITST